MLTSLNIATDGLLDGGSKPALAIATNGLIRYSVDVDIIDDDSRAGHTPRHGRGTSGKFDGHWKKHLAKEDEELLAFICSITPRL